MLNYLRLFTYQYGGSAVNERQYFFDALRGLAIILVIYSHICVLYLKEDTLFSHLCSYWRMPLFFFISGYFSYNNHIKIGEKVKNRLYKQLYPTLIICAIYLLFEHFLKLDCSLSDRLISTVYDDAKSGYWFTYSIVQVFLLFMIILYVFNRFHTDNIIRGIIVITLIVISSIPAVIGLPEIEVYPEWLKGALNILSVKKTLLFVPFYLFGVLCRIYEKRFLAVFGSVLFFIVVVVAFGVLCTANGDLVFYFRRWFSMMAVISFFCFFRRFFSPASQIGRYLIRVGKQTLPVYLFHYFIILVLSVYATEWSGVLAIFISNPVAEILTIGIMSLIIVEIILFLEQGLSKNTILHKLIYSY